MAPNDSHCLVESVLSYLSDKQAPERADLVSLSELARALKLSHSLLQSALHTLQSQHFVEVIEMNSRGRYVFITNLSRDWLGNRD